MNVMTKAWNDARRELNVRATKAARDVVMGLDAERFVL